MQKKKKKKMNVDQFMWCHRSDRKIIFNFANLRKILHRFCILMWSFGETYFTVKKYFKIVCYFIVICSEFENIFQTKNIPTKIRNNMKTFRGMGAVMDRPRR